MVLLVPVALGAEVETLPVAIPVDPGAEGAIAFGLQSADDTTDDQCKGTKVCCDPPEVSSGGCEEKDLHGCG